MSVINLISSEQRSILKNLKGGKYVMLKEILSDILLSDTSFQGEKMPSTRALAENLSISRSTVVRSYELLAFENIISPIKASGYVITQVRKKKKKNELTQDVKYPTLSVSAGNFLENVGLMNSTSDEEVAFRPGLPPLDIFPTDIWKKLTNQYWQNINTAGLSYSSASGLEQAKKNIAYYLKATRRITVDEEQIIIVSGSLQSLFLVGTTVLDPGDCVITENPTFPNIISLFKSLAANISPINIDRNGIAVKKFPNGINPKLIHVTPSNHYPTGTVMSLERRLELLNYAGKHGSLIIENEYDHEISNSEKHLPSIFELDEQQRTIFLGTFNRILHPSIRIAYLVLPYHLVDAVKALQKHSHRSVAPSLQAVLSDFIHKEHIFRHIKKVIHTAEERKKIFTNIIEKRFENLKQVHSQCPNLHILYELPENVDDKLLVRKLKFSGILAHAYSNTFYNNPKNGLIFGYSAIRTHLMEGKLSQFNL